MTTRLLTALALASCLTTSIIIATGLAFPAPQDTSRAAEPAQPILVSRQLLREIEGEIGDLVMLSPRESGDGARAFRIAGVYEPTPDPMRLVAARLEARLHLPDLMELTREPGSASSDEVTAINLALADPDDAPAFARDLSVRMPGINVRPAAPRTEASNPFVVLERFHLAIAVVTVAGSTIFLLALMVMLADERRATVGTLRLIGLTRRRVLLQVFIEGLLIASAGAAFGIALAMATQGAFNRFFQWRYDTALVFVRVSPAVVWQSLAVAVPFGIVAAVAASWTLLRRQVLTLVRR